VWRGIYAAEEAGLTPIKLNAVVVRHFNDGQDMLDLARLTIENDWEVRFIEMMPFGEVSDFQQTNVVAYAEMKAQIEARLWRAGRSRLRLSRPQPALPHPGRAGHAGLHQQRDGAVLPGLWPRAADGGWEAAPLSAARRRSRLANATARGRVVGRTARLDARRRLSQAVGSRPGARCFAENRVMNQIGG
jgi:hypothetical protein